MIAILSDIHGNLEALEAVLADIESKGISTTYCLGDVVGYGPDPIPSVGILISLEYLPGVARKTGTSWL